jgi:hypothetical protein
MDRGQIVLYSASEDASVKAMRRACPAASAGSMTRPGRSIAMRRATRYVIGVGLAIVLTISALPQAAEIQVNGGPIEAVGDGNGVVDISVIVRFGPGIDPTGL